MSDKEFLEFTANLYVLEGYPELSKRLREIAEHLPQRASEAQTPTVDRSEWSGCCC